MMDEEDRAEPEEGQVQNEEAEGGQQDRKRRRRRGPRNTACELCGMQPIGTIRKHVAECHLPWYV